MHRADRTSSGTSRAAYSRTPFSRFTTRKAAQVIGVTVNAPGRVRLVATGASSFKPKCVIKRKKKPCIRRDRKTGDWIVVHAVRFIYDGPEDRDRLGIAGLAQRNTRWPPTFAPSTASTSLNSDASDGLTSTNSTRASGGR